MITVVIPYFQRQAGVLRRSLNSVIAQRDCPLPIHVIVVDDSSPVPAESELKELAFPDCLTVEVIKQRNAGPGAARNTGLASAPPATTFVAFLDSDDEWTPDHLMRGTVALGEDFDFYFSDLNQLDQQIGAFARGGRIRPDEHPAVAGAAGLHAYQGDMFDQVMRGNVIGTPTVMLRHQTLGQLRFRTDLTSAGEDYLFWMSAAKAGAKIVFSSQVETVCGRGVNVYAGAQWASDEYFVRVRNELRYRQVTSSLFEVNEVQLRHLKQCIKSLRTDFALAVLHRIKARRPPPARLLWAQLRQDVWAFARIPVAVLQWLGNSRPSA